MRHTYTPRRQSSLWLDGDCPAEVLAIYDNRGTSADRYIVFYKEPVVGSSFADMWLGYRCMSASPSSPQGIGMYGEMEAYQVAEYRYRARHQTVKWSSLPEAVKDCVRRDCEEESHGALSSLRREIEKIARRVSEVSDDN